MNPEPPVPLNHFYAVLDSATYNAIKTDETIRRRFSASEERTTVRTDMTYTGLYFYGAYTYFEFFDAANSPVGGGGSVGIIFGGDRPGVLQALSERLPGEFTFHPEPITRPYDDKQVPWFYVATSKNLKPESGVNLCVMEYHHRFLAEWNPAIAQSEPLVGRNDVLKRYASVLESAPVKQNSEDVVGLSINLGIPAAAKLLELCALLGYRCAAEGDATSLEGPGIRIRVTADENSAQGLREIALRVNGWPEEKHEYHFGKSVLLFSNNGQATWSF